eukprot:1175534-Prorocentrum_minimum.AAC.3
MRGSYAPDPQSTLILLPEVHCVRHPEHEVLYCVARVLIPECRIRGLGQRSLPVLHCYCYCYRRSTRGARVAAHLTHEARLLDARLTHGPLRQQQLEDALLVHNVARRAVLPHLRHHQEGEHRLRAACKEGWGGVEGAQRGLRRASSWHCANEGLIRQLRVGTNSGLKGSLGGILLGSRNRRVEGLRGVGREVSGAQRGRIWGLCHARSLAPAPAVRCFTPAA